MTWASVSSTKRISLSDCEKTFTRRDVGSGRSISNRNLCALLLGGQYYLHWSL